MTDPTRTGLAPADRRRIIIVDDNYAVADGLKWALEVDGHEVPAMASTIEDALTLVAETQCDVAILDLDLSGESIEPVARALRARSIPFMFITGFGDVVELAADLSQAPRLEKPADPDEILATIAALSPTRK